jgi:hypothetical protein
MPPSAEEQGQKSEEKSIQPFFETVPEYCYISTSPDGTILACRIRSPPTMARIYKLMKLRVSRSFYDPRPRSHTPRLLASLKSEIGRAASVTRDVDTRKDGQKREARASLCGSSPDWTGNLLFLTSCKRTSRLQGSSTAAEQEVRLDAMVGNRLWTPSLPLMRLRSS